MVWGPDEVPAPVVKNAASKLACVLTSFFQQSLDTGILPSAWKDANVTATSVCKQVCSHLSANSAIYRDQHGFRKGMS